MSENLVDLSIRGLNEQIPPFSDPVVGVDDTIVVLLNIQGTRRLLGVGSTAYGELGAINPSSANPTLLSVNNNIGFSPYEPNISIIAGGQNMFGFVYVDEGVVLEDEVYTWGRNNKYQLGRGGKDPSGENIITQQAGPGRVDISGVAYTGTNRVRTYQMGWEHAHITTRNNRVFSWGDNYYGQLGISAQLQDPSGTGVEPQEITLSLGGDSPYAVYGGKECTVVLTNQGNVYAYGRNNYLQLGISDGGTTDFCENPIQISLSNVIHISTGESFVTALRGDGTVWGWGDDTYGQISTQPTTGSPRSIDVPTQILSISDAVYVTAGKNHTAILRSTGNIVLVGDNQFTQADSPSPNRNLLYGLAVANNTFYIELDGDLLGYGAGISDGSSLLGNDEQTTGPGNPITITPNIANLAIDTEIRVLYTKVLVLDYLLIPEEEVREVLKYDEDQTPSTSDYLEQKKAICLVKDIARKTNSTITSGEACCTTGPNQKPILRFKSFKEKMAYERGLYIMNKNCLIKN